MIVVAGEALVDLVPVPVGAEVLHRANPGGGPFNTAVTLGRLGAPVAFAGALSADGFGRLLRARLAEAGVDLAAAPVLDAPTPLAVVTLGGEGTENLYSFHLAGTTLDAGVPALAGVLPAATALHVGTLGTTVEPLASVIETVVASEHHRLVVGFDPNVRPQLVQDRGAFVERVHRLAAMADVVKVSDADAAWITDGEPAAGLAERWLGYGASLVVVTRGGAGAEAWTRAGHVQVEAHPATVVDTVGAGDAFNGGLLAWLHRHGLLTADAVRSLPLDAALAALRFAGLVAARTCERPGADPPWIHDLPEDPA